MMNEIITVALAGNPNVGKSTIFNALTGMKQHTGNWTGKTVDSAVGYFKTEKHNYRLVDLPGTYSLLPHSPEEKIARDYVINEQPEAVIVVCDATCLERNLNLVLQTIKISKKVIVCVNLLDEAKRKGITVDLKLLSFRLGVKVVGTNARNKKTIINLLQALDKVIDCKEENCMANEILDEKLAVSIVKNAELICNGVITYKNENFQQKDRKIDKIITSRYFAYPIMLLLLSVVFWITISGANYPSDLLFSAFSWLEEKLSSLLIYLHFPIFLHDALVFGIYRTVSFIVSVMLPPMAIFFPLFTLLEDLGFLPRIAYNLDKPFKKCNACGKQALTMCMGFGCNAAGIVGCRIIDAPRERLVAMITNCFVPCNGRFPTIIAIITMFFAFGNNLLSTAILTAVVILGVFMTFFVSRLLSKTVLKGKPSAFAMELPPYRKPRIWRVIVSSVFDRTIFVLGRALAFAAPAGLVIWLFANVYIGDISVLKYCADFLDGFAYYLGLDGVILLAFILGLPANEIVVPIILMAYLSQGTLVQYENLNSLKTILVDNGWTLTTAVCTILFTLIHWPCSTTLLTIKKETGSIKWTLVSLILPTVIGMIVCFVTAIVLRMF